MVSKGLPVKKNHGAIRIPDIPFGSLEGIAAGDFLQLVLAWNGTIL
jgi:hypothetical protein